MHRTGAAPGNGETSPSGARRSVRRRTLLTTALAAVPAVMAGGIVSGTVAWAASASRGLSVSGLKVEHRVNPFGVDATRPRFGWRMESSTRGQRQTAYQILVASSPERLTRSGADLWNSGRVTSSDSVAVRYSGMQLHASTRYYWTVLVWDKDGHVVSDAPSAFFETGLLSTDGMGRWSGAKWISMAGKKPNSPGAPMLRRQVALRGGVSND